MHGVLLRRISHAGSAKYNKKFYVVRDGFLFYYADNERKDFDKRNGSFNIHPKGAYPLGAVSTYTCRLSNQAFCIKLSGGELEEDIILAAESEVDRQKWIDAFLTASKITGPNLRIMHDIVRNLREQGEQIAVEKQDYVDKYHSEIRAREDDREKLRELEKVKAALEKEKNEMERVAQELLDEQDRITRELSQTTKEMVNVDDEKTQLLEMVQVLERTLQDLQSERKVALTELQSAKSGDNLHHRSHSESTFAGNSPAKADSNTQLQDSLKSIEQKMASLSQELVIANQRLEEKRLEKEELEEEKQLYSIQAQELQESLKDLTEQKNKTQTELETEIKARMEAEERLQKANGALSRLENAVATQHVCNCASNVAETAAASKQPSRSSPQFAQSIEGDAMKSAAERKQEMLEFFEDLAFDSQFEANRTRIMRHAIESRRNFSRRARSLRMQAPHKNKRAWLRASTFARPPATANITDMASVMSTSANIPRTAPRPKPPINPDAVVTGSTMF